MSQKLMIENQLCFAVYSTQLAINKLYRQKLKSLDLTYPQYLVMLVLWRQDELTVTEIGEQLFLDSATLTPLLKRLEAQGLILRRRAEVDERQVNISLTANGKSLKRKALTLPASVQDAMNCNDKEWGDLRRKFHRLRDNILNTVAYD